MLFASTDCTVCDELKPDLERFAATRCELETALICAGTHEDVRGWTQGMSEQVEIVPDPGYRIASRYGVGVTPFLVGSDAAGVVRTKGIVNDLRNLEFHAEQILATQEKDKGEQRLVKLERRS